MIEWPLEDQDQANDVNNSVPEHTGKVSENRSLDRILHAIVGASADSDESFRGPPTSCRPMSYVWERQD